jgi:hypothetical protein
MTGNTEWLLDRRRSGRGSRLLRAATARRPHAREAISDRTVRGQRPPVLKRVIAVAGDVAERGPEALTAGSAECSDLLASYRDTPTDASAASNAVR